MTTSIADWGLAAKNLFLPIFCKQCGVRLFTEENGFFCPTCWEMSPRIERPFCTFCGRPHQQLVGFGTQSNFPCADCRDLKRRPLRRIYGAARYQDAVASAIKLLKFYDKVRIVEALADVMMEFAREEMECDTYDFIVPVPLHRVRERDRGYNQARLLAQAILPVFSNARIDESLQRIRPTRVQSRIHDKAARKANIRGAFAVVGDNYPKGSRILLIDDVATTSGTLSECARALKRARATEVDGFVAALAVHAPTPER